MVAAIWLVAEWGWLSADPIIALMIAAILVASAWHVFRQSLDQLMDHELPPEQRERIKSIIKAHPEVLSLHELKTRQAGLHTFIQVHIELPPHMKLAEAHHVSDAVENDLMAAFPHAQVIIHQDPAGLEQPPAEP